MIRLIELLKEIGDSSYPYKKDPDSSKDEIIYKFELEDGTEFEVNIFVISKGKIEIDFTSDYSWETTDRGSNMFKIFSTIKDKDFKTKINSQKLKDTSKLNDGKMNIIFNLKSTDLSNIKIKH